MRRASRLVLALAALLAAPRLGAQGIGSLVSPGKLAKPHAKLEGLDKCQSCHEPGRQVTAARCLECHKPVAERIRARKGVHRGVTGNDCAGCHVEHAGLDGDLRHFEPKGFDHKGDVGYALDGLHAPLDCKACHKTRSYLGLSSSCASCHKDVHNGTLGATCQTCHAMSVAFKDTRKGFDHGKTKYALTGAHAKTPCESCHKTKGEYRIARFATCEDCHKNPHKPALGLCTTCHVTTSFKTLAEGQKFDHAKTGYPLRGRHASVACQTCHVKPATAVRLRYARCGDCHHDSHKGLFPAEDCAACHMETGFRPAKFDHATRTKFSLDGKHAAAACVACHKAAGAQARVPLAQRIVDFRGAKKECASCHADVHKGKLGPTCETCHGTSSFKLSAYQHPRQPEFFQGAHLGVTCEKCHLPERALAAGLAKGVAAPAARQYRGVSFQCAACHKDAHLGQVGTDCAKCHGLATKGYKADLFVHTHAKFALTGKHETVPCAKCHAKETGTFPAGSGTAVRFTGISTECRACHKDPHFGQLSPRCETCHDTASFRVAKFTHPKKRETEEFFVAKHATIACAECHRKETFNYPAGRGTAVRYSVPVACTHCHEDAHRGALGRDCASCHNAVIWRTASRAFHKAGLFPLEGKHLSTPCSSCHVKGVLKGTPTGCFDCHWIRKPDDRFKTKLGSDCQTCHRPIAWTAVTWSHAAATGFNLETPHKTLDCESCHKGQVFPGTPKDCYSCHRADYERVQNPSHVAGGFPTDCTGCHKPFAPTWQGATFVHSTFPLSGVHTTQVCAACHVNNVYKGTPRDCFSCHRTDYQSSKNPPHAAAAFPTTCDTCHKFSDPNWQGAGFNHNVTTTFALAGVHVTQPCTACHVNNVYKGTPRDCYSCHKTIYQNSKNPPHLAGGFATTCDTCHKYTDPAWSPSSFNHSTNTTFPLAGTHVTQPCTACHTTTPYKNAATTCVGCHQTDYNNSKNPPHAASGFATACDSCHKFSDTTWLQATFSHTTFPLAGVHATTACTVCHNPSYAPSANNYTAVPTTCYGCHQRDVTGATTPVNHSGLPTTCDSCHKNTDATWSLKGSFVHNTYFALAGTHVTAPCAQCHNPPYAPSANNFTTVPTSPCSACHINDYNAAKTPVDHIASSFPTTCDSCHKFSDTTWLQATFSHTTFPLSGVHATTACTVCHNPPYAPSANNYTAVPTTCYGCHQRDVTGATTPVNHSGLPTTCDSCHKNTDATWLLATAFNHSTYFALAGTHATTACATCHNPPYAPSANNYLSVPTSPCSACHQTDYNNAKTPVDHIASSFPNTCDSCHKFTDATWLLATFSHTTFPLVGPHATTACATCHNPPYAPSANNYTAVPTTCFGCHVRDFNGAATALPVPHTGLPTTCDTCHKNTDATWSQKGAFVHNAYFAVAGAHATAPCSQCHNPPYAPSANNYISVPTSPCSACHQKDYNTATTPVNHIASAFPNTCDSCHKFSDATWLLATFSHTIFPLAGPHATTACTVCHNPPYAPSANNYTAVPTTCYGCHQRDVTGATTPVNHSGLPTTCDSCHKNTDATWLLATAFNHSTYFALAGAHVPAPCAQCHTGGNFVSVPTSPCSACHLPAYQTATTPVNHVAAAFPTTCDTCHKFSDTTWLQGTFNHTYFPLTSNHNVACNRCHTTANVYTVFNCTVCHTAATTNSHHSGVKGYVWTSTACYSCHPNGRAG